MAEAISPCLCNAATPPLLRTMDEWWAYISSPERSLLEPYDLLYMKCPNPSMHKTPFSMVFCWQDPRAQRLADMHPVASVMNEKCSSPASRKRLSNTAIQLAPSAVPS